MGIKFIISYIRKCNNSLRAVGREEGVSMFRLWVDSIWSFFIYGCTIRQYTEGGFFRYSSFEREKVLTCKKFFKLVKATNDPNYIKYLEDKAEFNRHFSVFVKRRWVSSLEMTESEFGYVCDKQKGIIVKPLYGMEGDGISVIGADCLISEDSRHKIYARLKESKTIIEEIIEQHPSMRFNSNSVNTIRAITLMDKTAHEVTMIKAVLRAGVGDVVVDNYHQGGCCYEVDVLLGRVCSYGVSTSNKGIIVHPGTDICMLGYEIPNWDKVVSGCIDAHKMLPQCRYISWDVAITRDGMELIEGNHNGDYDMIEFVGRGKYWPLLKHYL